MSQADFDNQKQRNEEAFGLLYDIEILLREFCANKLEALHGSKWAKRGLAPDVLEKVKSSVLYEQKSKWHRAILHHPLYYVDFPDLKKIVISGANWNTIFGDTFGPKAATEGSLSELELLRNQVAHNRFVSDGDLQVLRGLHTKLMQSLPQEDLEKAQRSANARIPVIQNLKAIAASIETALLSMNRAAPLSPDELLDEGLIDSWWFDIAYLGQSIEPIKNYRLMCKGYSQIPRGIGQAIYRKKWIEDHDALTLGAAASTAMNALITQATKFYE